MMCPKELLSCLLLCAGLGLIGSCSSAPAPQTPPHDLGLPADPVLGVADTGTRCSIPAMIQLWHRRLDARSKDYSLGPGDELTVSVPEIDELQNQQVRIAQDGSISLPLIGIVDVGGLDENQARNLISQRLARYMKKPRLELFVEKYRSRGVAVEGAVQKPGVYDLASFADSLADIIAMAGGLAPDAAQRAVLLPIGFTEYSTPVVSSDRTQITPVEGFGNEQQASQEDEVGLARRVSIIVPFGRAGDAGCLNMPARPGDIILVPTAGTVTVVGWVQNPGSFAISPGMTVLGAVTAAGGAVYSWHAEVLRTDENGERVVKQFSLSDLESGAQRDIPVEAGDVVLVEKSVIGAVPYALWELFDRFGTGVGMGIPVP
jgi:polysaccharide biosynthesis/export protein